MERPILVSPVTTGILHGTHTDKSRSHLLAIEEIRRLLALKAEANLQLRTACPFAVTGGIRLAFDAFANSG